MEAPISTPDDSAEAGQWYPTPTLSPIRKAALVKTFLDLHKLKVNEWDMREDQRGHVILKWAEPELTLGAVVVLSADTYAVEIGRDEYRGNRWGYRRRKTVNETSDYDLASESLVAVLGEIAVHRGKKKSA